LVIAARHGGLGCCYKEIALSREKERRRQREKFQHRAPKTILKDYQEFYLSNTLTITSLIHLRDYPLYPWSQVHTVRVRTATSCRDFPQSSSQFGRGPFNPHLPSGFTFLRTRRYRLPGAGISEHRFITIRGVFRGVVIRQGSIIYIYRGDGLRYRFRLVALATEVQEVES